jgi:hypothetical protein
MVEYLHCAHPPTAVAFALIAFVPVPDLGVHTVHWINFPGDGSATWKIGRMRVIRDLDFTIPVEG